MRKGARGATEEKLILTLQRVQFDETCAGPGLAILRANQFNQISFLHTLNATSAVLGWYLYRGGTCADKGLVQGRGWGLY